MRRILSIALTLAVMMAFLPGCSGRPAVTPPPGEPGQSVPNGPANSPGSGEGGAVKTGLSIYTSLANSQNASVDWDGSAVLDITLVAVTVDDGGVIHSCVIDQIKPQITFDSAGRLTTDPATVFASKRELGEAYGMKEASSIGQEWYQQAQAMADYAVGKTVAQLKGLAVDQRGVPTEADLAASVTISIADFVSGIETAVNQAQHLGAQRGERLTLAASTDISGSQDASAGHEGLAQTQVTGAAVTFSGETITSCVIDGVQADVNFSGEGAITTDLSLPQRSKNQLGDAYGMKGASPIGKEWYEQAAAFGAYVRGKTAQQVSAIAVDEGSRPADADLSASVTISIGQFQGLLEKAAQ